MPCPQFSIRPLLWLTLVVAAFLAGMVIQGHRDATRIAELDEIEILHQTEMKLAFDRDWYIQWLKEEVKSLKTEHDLEVLKGRLDETPAP